MEAASRATGRVEGYSNLAARLGPGLCRATRFAGKRRGGRWGGTAGGLANCAGSGTAVPAADATRQARAQSLEALCAWPRRSPATPARNAGLKHRRGLARPGRRMAGRVTDTVRYVKGRSVLWRTGTPPLSPPTSLVTAGVTELGMDPARRGNNQRGTCARNVAKAAASDGIAHLPPSAPDRTTDCARSSASRRAFHPTAPGGADRRGCNARRSRRCNADRAVPAVFGVAGVAQV